MNATPLVFLIPGLVIVAIFLVMAIAIGGGEKSKPPPSSEEETLRAENRRLRKLIALDNREREK